MALTVREAESLDEVDAAYVMASAVFGGTDAAAAEDDKARRRAADPLVSTNDAIVAIESGIVVGFVRVVSRTVHLRGRALPVGGITSVAVADSHRGRGIGAAVVSAAVRRCASRGDAVSIAFARRAVDGFYPRFGYVGLGTHPELRFAVSGATSVACAAPSARAELASTFAAAHEATYGTQPFRFDRNGGWWRRQLTGRSEHVGIEWRALTLGDDVVGYVARDGGVAIEVAVVEPLAGDVWPMVAAAGAGISGAFRVGHGHPLARAARETNHTWSVRFAWDGGHMLRVVDVDRFAEAAGLGPTDVSERGAESLSHDAALRLGRRYVTHSCPADWRDSLPVWSRADEF